jgi:hypothetical protein
VEEQTTRENEALNAIYNVSHEYGTLLRKAKPGLDEATLAWETTKMIQGLKHLGPKQQAEVIDGIVNGYHEEAHRIWELEHTPAPGEEWDEEWTAYVASMTASSSEPIVIERVKEE